MAENTTPLPASTDCFRHGPHAHLSLWAHRQGVALLLPTGSGPAAHARRLADSRYECGAPL